MIPEETVAEIRERTDIAQLVGEYVALKRSGASLKGLCPFHSEKTPSFYVHPERGFFHCFGCQASGDVFKFLMRLDGRSFPEAVRVLAERAGIEIQEGDRREDRAARARRERRQRYLAVLEAAAAFYERMLVDHRLRALAEEELQRRGMTPETVAAYRLGYAPHGWDNLSKHLAAKGHHRGEAEAVGLIAPRRSGDGTYDRFRHRLMFPVADAQGRVIAFSGRALPPPPGDDRPGADKPAKYINSPEHPLYTKGEVLFGIHQARVALRREDWGILCEGNFDVLALAQAGFPNTVAPLGTALTPAQVKLLRRYVSRVVLLFDGDAAGLKAVRAAQPILSKAGLGAKVVVLPPGEDPDSFVRGQGGDALTNLVERAPGIVEVLIEAGADAALGDAGRVADAIAELGPVLATVDSPVERQLYIERVATTFGVRDQRVVRDQLRRGFRASRGPARRVQRESVPPPVEAPAAPFEAPPLEGELVSAFLDHPELGQTDLAEDVRRLLTSEELRAIFCSALRPDVNAMALLSEHEDNPARRWLEERLAVQTFDDQGEARAFVERTVPVLLRRRAKREQSRLDREILHARRMGDDARAEELLRRKSEVFRSAARFGSERSKG